MQRPVAVFDSGVGGLCLLKKVKRYLPYENFLYFADNKNVPYGNKRQSEIEELMKNNMQTILKHNPKAVLIGCNTVTAICLQGLKNDYPNVFFAGTLPNVDKCKKPCILFATQSSVNTSEFAKIAKQKDMFLFPLKQGAQMIESGCSDDDFKKYLDYILSGINLYSFGSMVLGCTHYLYKRKVFESFGLPVYDNLNQIAGQFADELKAKDLCQKSMIKGSVSFFLSDGSATQFKKYTDFYQKA